MFEKMFHLVLINNHQFIHKNSIFIFENRGIHLSLHEVRQLLSLGRHIDKGIAI